jgi:hypothetical protein
LETTSFTTASTVPTVKIMPASTFAVHDVPEPVTVLEPAVTVTVPVE